MKYFVWLALFLLLPLFALNARPLVVPTLPESDFADTESATNIVIDVSDPEWGRLDIVLAANATVSNNVQIAFGIDANEDGELCPAETDLVLGWDSGAWFIRDERAEWAERWMRESGMRELRAFVRVKSQKGRALELKDGETFFSERIPTVPATLFNPAWNLLRVTSRGHALRDELVTVSPYRYGLLLEVK